jgi:ankyrin repeat protein
MTASRPEGLENGQTDPATINAIHPVTGMSPLHIAVGIDRLDLVRSLVEAGARFFPDKQGRMPSLIAALCETSEEMQDYITEQERKIETNQ